MKLDDHRCSVRQHALSKSRSTDDSEVQSAAPFSSSVGQLSNLPLAVNLPDDPLLADLATEVEALVEMPKLFTDAGGQIELERLLDTRGRPRDGEQVNDGVVLEEATEGRSELEEAARSDRNCLSEDSQRGRKRIDGPGPTWKSG